MTDKTDLIREILEYVTTHGGQNTATHLLVQAASAIQAQAAELEAVGAGGVQALSAAPAVPEPPQATSDPIQAAADAASVGHLSRLLDHQSAMLAGAMKSMRAIELAASPIDESHGDFDARIPSREWAAFVDARAALLHDFAQSPVASPTPPAEQQAAPKAAPGELNESAYQRGYLDGMAKGSREVEAAPQQEAQEPKEIPEAIERMADDRYKVVPSHESMFHRWAVVATGTQQLYLGREAECQNMARKFAGAFLDGAFVAMQQAAPQPAPAPLSEQDPLQGAANWLVTAHPALETSTLAGKLSIGYNRAKRLHDAALAAQGGAA